MEFPPNLKYTQEHEWVRLEDNVAIVGITAFAAKELGDIVYVEVETVDETLAKEDVFGVIEAVKTVADLYMPLSSKIIAYNNNLEESPELSGEDPYDAGWIIKIEISDPSELDDLFDAETYKTTLIDD